jgi:hypothetical protein
MTGGGGGWGLDLSQVVRWQLGINTLTYGPKTET